MKNFGYNDYFDTDTDLSGREGYDPKSDSDSVCECTDPGCWCDGKCTEPKNRRVRRVDMEDGTGATFEFCDECAHDAVDSGVFVLESELPMGHCLACDGTYTGSFAFLRHDCKAVQAHKRHLRLKYKFARQAKDMADYMAVVRMHGGAITDGGESRRLC